MEMTDKPTETPPPQEAREVAEPPAQEAEESPRHEPKGALPGERGTRLSGAWTAIVVGLVGLVVILIFILQNGQSVEVTFLAFSGHLPLAVALLFALILGAIVVFAFGAARILQLRRVAGRARRQGHGATPPAE
jgi:putative membrane protein